MEAMSEINDIKEISEGTFPIYLKIIYQYEWIDPSLMSNFKTGTYKCGFIVE